MLDLGLFWGSTNIALERYDSGCFSSQNREPECYNSGISGLGFLGFSHGVKKCHKKGSKK